MLSDFPSIGFLTELTSRINIPEGASSIEGQGKQAIVVAHGDSAYKVFASSKTHCGVSAHTLEVAALEAFGGYEGDAILTPRLKSHFLFQSPFEMMGKNYIGMIEQSRLEGVHPKPTTSFQLADMGNALGELHILLNQHGQNDLFMRNIVAHRIHLLKDQKAKGHFILPGMRKRILAQVSPIAMDYNNQSYVHGDFHMGNVSFNGNRYGIYDLATVGRSVPEQDMTFFAHKPDGLKDLFNGYAKHHKKKPSKSKVMALYSLDLAIAADFADRSGRLEQAKNYADKLEAMMS